MTPATRTVAILFTDIAGSTEKWAHQSDAMGRALQQHDDLSQVVIERHGALLSKHTGDGSMAAFPSVAAAVQAAIDLQREISAAEWPTAEPLRLRAGIHVGDAELRDGDAFGSAVNRAARLMGAAHPRQVLVSAAVDAAARDSMDGYDAREVGPVTLRGLSEPAKCFQVVAEGLERDFPDLGAPTVDGLPEIHNEFIGRRRDLAAVAGALQSHRLVTVSGPGGVGKTRLAIEVARQLRASMTRAWFADLAKFPEPELVGAGIRSGLAIPDQSGRSELDVSLEFLSRRAGLLVVDNCEHVLDAAADAMRRILRQAPRIKLLATSQERLGLPDETVWPLRPFLEGDQLADAVRLFAARAEAVNPHVDLDGEADTIRELCVELDGLPLAIELAASRCSAMSPSQIRERLSDRFRLLGRRRAEDRHGSLRATVDWSYDLLDGNEQALFGALAVFPAGFTLEMAERVAPAAGIDEFETLDILASLVDKSLVAAETGAGARYRYLDTLRRYALETMGDGARTGAQHALADWAESTVTQLTPDLVPDVDREVPNLEAAFDHMMDGGDHERAYASLSRLLNSLPDHYATWQRLFRRITEEAPAAQVRVDAAGDLAVASWYGNDPEAVQSAQKALEQAEEAGLRPSLAALTTLAFASAQDNDPDKAADFIGKAARVAEQTGGDYDRYAVTLSSIWTHLALGNLDEALSAADEVVRMADSLEPARLPMSYGIASLPYRYVDPWKALELTNRAVAIGKETGQKFWLFAGLAHRGFCHIRLKDYTGALHDFIEALPHGVAVGDGRLVCSVVDTIAGLVSRSGRPHAAAVLLAGSLAERERRNTSSGTREDHEWRARSKQRLRAALGDDFDRAWAEGTALPAGDVFEMALSLARELLKGAES